VDRLHHVLAGQAGVVLAARAGGPVDLGEDLQALPALALQRLAQDALGLGVGVDVGGVEGRDSLVERGAHALVGHLVLHLGPVGQPVAVGDLADLEPAVAEVPEFHPPSLRSRRGCSVPRARILRGRGGVPQADYGGGMTYRSGWQDDDRGQEPREGDELAAPPGPDPMLPSPGIDPSLQPPPLPGPQTPGAGMPEAVRGAPGSWQQAGGAAYPSGGPGHLPARRQRDQPMVSAFGDLVRTGAWDAAQKTVSYQVFGDV